MMFGSMLGLSVRAVDTRFVFNHPRLPAFLTEVRLEEFSIGDSRLQVQLRGDRDHVDIHIQRQRGAVEAVIVDLTTAIS